MHKADGSTRRFKESKRGLYFMDILQEFDGNVLVTTVEDKKSSYTQRDYSQAELARRLQNILGYTGLRDYLKIIDDGLLPNCPVTPSDIKAAPEDIFGPNLGALKGKTVRTRPNPVEVRVESVPVSIMEKNRNVTLIMMVNKLRFFISVSSKEDSFRHWRTDRECQGTGISWVDETDTSNIYEERIPDYRGAYGWSVRVPSWGPIRDGNSSKHHFGRGLRIRGRTIHPDGQGTHAMHVQYCTI
jgi:hypothetical protein